MTDSDRFNRSLISLNTTYARGSSSRELIYECFPCFIYLSAASRTTEKKSLYVSTLQKWVSSRESF